MMFVDTGAWVARHHRRDQHHREAVEGWRQIEHERPPLYTSSFVIGEVATLLSRRAGSRFAVERVRRIYESTAIHILRPESHDEIAALGWMNRYADQRIGFTDCVSFVLMKQHGLQRAFTFDRHFEIVGFERWPGVY